MIWLKFSQTKILSGFSIQMKCNNQIEIISWLELKTNLLFPSSPVVPDSPAADLLKVCCCSSLNLEVSPLLTSAVEPRSGVALVVCTVFVPAAAIDVLIPVVEDVFTTALVDFLPEFGVSCVRLRFMTGCDGPEQFRTQWLRGRRKQLIMFNYLCTLAWIFSVESSLCSCNNACIWALHLKQKQSKFISHKLPW